jgi:hypothetical protein
VGVRKLLLEGTDAIRRTGQSDDTKSAARETPDNRGAGAGPDAGDDGNWFVSHGLCLVIA